MPAGAFGQRRGRSHSKGILRALAAVEVPQVLDPASDFPVVLTRARGARVVDVDGNRYLDLTSFFGAALVGHRDPRVTAAVRAQAGRLLHAMGDVHPPDVLARFLRALVTRLPAPDYRGLLSLNGSDAVECALKFAAAATGRGAVVAFEGSYHGLTAGALEVTAQQRFRTPFAATLSGRGRFVPFPAVDGSDADAVLSAIRAHAQGDDPAGAVIVEPIQGRGGIRVPPPGFLRSLADLCRDEGLILIADEVYTGVRRTGPFLACERDGVAPDAVCLGKALGGGMPVSACLMRPALANAVARLPFEAAHTSTFLGHPLACAAGLAVLRTLDLPAFRGAPERIEAAVRARGADWRTRLGCVVRDVRGAGAMMGIELSAPDGGPGGPLAARVCAAALRRGVLVLTEGEAGDVLSLTPPLVVADGDLHRALDRLEASLTEALT